MIHIKAKLGEASWCLYVIRSLRKEGYNQEHIDLFFKSVILSKLTCGLSVYGACNSELNVVQSFLNHVLKGIILENCLISMNIWNNSIKDCWIKLGLMFVTQYIHSYLKLKICPCICDREPVNCQKSIPNLLKIVS